MIASLSLALFLAAASQEPAPPTDASGLTALLLERKDNAEADLVRRLANLKTPEALDGLIRVLDVLGSLYLRLVTVRSLGLFDSVEGAGERALQKLVDVATLSQESELREAAVDTIADCPRLGKAFLALLVESSADETVRERALRHHIGSPRPEDIDWYRGIYRPESAGDRKGKKRKEGDETRVFPRSLRKLAFEGLAPSLSSDELLEAIQEGMAEVRKLALEQLGARRDPHLLETAERIYEDRKERPATRLEAARILLAEKGSRQAERLLKDATRSDVPLELSFGIADLLSALEEPRITSLLLKELGQGQPAEKRFTLRAARAIPDPKVDKALIELSDDRDLDVRQEAVKAMGARGNLAFIPRLEELLAESQEESLLAAAFDALARMQGSDPAWRSRLVELARSDRELVRNAALEAIGRTRDAQYLPVLVTALGHGYWSTRLAAARAIEELRLEAGVGALCQRLGQEEGRMTVELADILWRLTGLPFRADASQWERWWQNEGASFRIPSREELEKREQDREERRLKQVTKSSTFFGVRVISHRVSFVIDVSGSMEERIARGTDTKGSTRLEIAKRELIACLDALDAGTYFNLIPFSNGVTPWKPRALERTSATLTEAREFVERLGALGGTNIHGALESAFADPSVDTIYFLSDGEPSTGALVDPAAIRMAVQAWNEHRGVVIHTISIGDRFPLLEWLAKDSGGTHTTFP